MRGVWGHERLGPIRAIVRGFANLIPIESKLGILTRCWYGKEARSHFQCATASHQKRHHKKCVGIYQSQVLILGLWVSSPMWFWQLCQSDCLMLTTTNQVGTAGTKNDSALIKIADFGPVLECAKFPKHRRAFTSCMMFNLFSNRIFAEGFHASSFFRRCFLLTDSLSLSGWRLENLRSLTNFWCN